jgi:hypothetical protein
MVYFKIIIITIIIIPMSAKKISLLLIVSVLIQFSTFAQQPVIPPSIVYVDAIGDFPKEQNGIITLNPAKVYVLSGFVDIGQASINLNGAGLRGTDPTKDGVISAVKGAVLRSNNVDVYLEKVAVILASPSTMAYDLIDDTGTKFLNFLAGNSVLDVPRVQSLGAGKISGFNSIYINSNFLRCHDGYKIGGTTGKFCASFNYLTGIGNTRAGIEFLADFAANDIDLSNNYFVFSGSVAVKMSTGASFDQGRMTGNLFRGPSTLLQGFDSHTPGWIMRNNGAGVPDTKPYGYAYMNDNQQSTKFISPTLYAKVAGNTTTTKANGFVATQNRFTYTGKRQLTAQIYVNAGVLTPEPNSEIAISIYKNGQQQVAPNSSIGIAGKKENVQITLETEVDLIQGDYIEVFIKNNINTTPILVKDLQFRVSE